MEARELRIKVIVNHGRFAENQHVAKIADEEDDSGNPSKSFPKGQPIHERGRARLRHIYPGFYHRTRATGPSGLGR